jgi:phenylpyruvate tautomerase PptA (4-oxalocrotonate tautomerase family)
MPLIIVTFSSQDSRLAPKATIAAEVNKLSATFLNGDVPSFVELGGTSVAC